MKSSLRFAISLAATIACTMQFSFAQSKTAQGIADEFVKAWNSHSAKAFERIFTKDAIWVPVANVMTKGRTQIVRDFAEIHKTWAKTTTVKHEAVTVLPVSSNVATIFFHARYLEKGKINPNIDRAVIMVVKKEKVGWRIAAGQLTKQHDGA